MYPKSSLYLWDQRTLYVGEAFDLNSITPAASILVYCIDGTMKVTAKGSSKTIVTQSILLPAGLPFNATADSKRVSICFLDAYGVDFHQCKQFMKNSTDGIYFDSKEELHHIELLEDIYVKRLPEDVAYKVMVEHFFLRPKGVKQERCVDDRIVKVVEFIKSNFSENHSNQYLADIVGMSDVQLRRMFKKTTQIPIRRYRLWHRLFVTANLMVLGYTLTDASIAAGFSDSSHFNHVFRSMLGINPSFVLKRAQSICLFAPHINNRLIGEILNLGGAAVDYSK